MSRHLIILTAAALSACSAAMQPSPNEVSLNQTSLSQPIEPRAFVENLTPASPIEAVPAELTRLPDEPLAGAPRSTRASRTSCDIIVQPTSHGIRLKAVARLAEPVSGHYSMVVTKRGRAGSSDITQGGPFKSSGNRDVSLSSSELSGEEASHYQAILTLHVRDRQVCRREVRS